VLQKRKPLSVLRFIRNTAVVFVGRMSVFKMLNLVEHVVTTWIKDLILRILGNGRIKDSEVNI
jgi:hypothetical protein